MKISFVVVTSLLLFLSCSTDYGVVSSNLHKISSEYAPLSNGNYFISDWGTSQIFCSSPMRSITLDSDYNLITNKVFSHPGVESFIASDAGGKKLLFVKTGSLEFSLGELYELDISSGNAKLLLPDSILVSSARYMSNGNDFIYYRAGTVVANTVHQTNSGYYLFTRSNSTSTLILPFVCELGLYEVVNSFSLYPLDTAILIAVSHADTPPILLKYSFATNEVDTMLITFEFGKKRQSLWARLNRAGTKVLYGTYPNSILSDYTDGDTEMGIVDIESYDKRIFNINTSSTHKSLNVFPNWSNDETEIIFGSTIISTTGDVSSYDLYVHPSF